MTKKKGRDNPEGLTAREVIEDIAAFPLRQAMELDERGGYKSGSSGWTEGYAAWRNQRFAETWLKSHPKS